MEWLKTELCIGEVKDVNELKYKFKNTRYWRQFNQTKYFEVSLYFYECVKNRS